MPVKSSFRFVLFVVVLLLSLVSVPCVAEATPKKVLSDKDIAAFAANHDRIENDLEALGSKYDNLISEPSGEASINASFAKIRATKVPTEVEAVLERNGLGKNGLEKIVVISYGYMTLMTEDSLVQEKEIVAANPSMKSYFDDLRKQIKDIKAGIHPDDLKLIAANKDKLSNALGTGDVNESGDYSEE
jgi:hypothetical protein